MLSSKVGIVALNYKKKFVFKIVLSPKIELSIKFKTTESGFLSLYVLHLRFLDHTDFRLNLLSAKITKWSNTLKQFVGKLPTNCLSVFDHFVGLALKGLSIFGEPWNFLALIYEAYSVINFNECSYLQVVLNEMGKYHLSVYITRRPLYRVLDSLGKKRQKKLG